MMKQTITLQQFKSLPERLQKDLSVKYFPPYYMLQHIKREWIDPLTSKKIVEFASENGKFAYIAETGEFFPLPSIGQMLEVINEKGNQDVCDKLFEKMKEMYETL